MSWWDNYKARFTDNVRHGAGDGLRAAASGKTSSDVANQRREKQYRQASIAAIQAFIAQQQPKYDAIAAAERARGNRNYVEATLGVADFDGMPAVARFNMNGQRGKIEIFYGGSGHNPLDNDDHGHIIMVNGDMVSWEEPGPKGKRNKLF